MMKAKTRAGLLDKRSSMNIMHQNPALFQVNTRVWLTELSRQLGRPATLDDIPESFFDNLAERGFVWAYFLSVWQTGAFGRRISQSHPGWVEEFRADLPDLTEEDICGSGFAITDYALNRSFGKPDALKRLRNRLNKRGMMLMLDCVPNHTAVDHAWVKSHPQYYVHGDEEACARAPQNYLKVEDRILAHGRDPYFDGWPDTLQLNYGNSELRQAMLGELSRIAASCDGVRCDMAMLIMPEIFKCTWAIEIESFWPVAIRNTRKINPDFVFMAEVYWDKEWELQQQGFNFTYDKKLYDRLRQGDARLVREHFWADIEYQRHSARFLENHDEPRAAGLFSDDQHKAAAVLTFLCPGLRFLHQGQFEGYRKRVPVHLSRRPYEHADPEFEKFYGSLMACMKLPVVHSGNWKLLECTAAWDGNWTWDCFIAFSWTDCAGHQLMAVVNYSSHQSQCYVRIPPTGQSRNSEMLEVLLGGGLDACDIRGSELYLDLRPWGYIVFSS